MWDQLNQLRAWMGSSEDEFWVLSLCRNISSYAFLILPFYLLYRLAKGQGLVSRAEAAVQSETLASSPWLIRLVAYCVVEKPKEIRRLPTLTTVSPSRTNDTLMLGFCFGGLMTMYLTWGVMQEKMMTQDYVLSVSSPDNPVIHRFKDSQFLVFVNRVSALCLALVLTAINSYPTLRAPLYKFSYASLSNIMSSWFQYEALKHIIFPVQVLGKSFKIVPVMLMSRIVSGSTYARHEYLTSLLISAGCGLFLYSQGTGSKPGKMGGTLEMSGLVIMAGYIAFDSFTSNWQSELKNQYDVHKTQLMLGVNIFSTAFTLFACLLQGTFFASITFVFTHSGYHLLLLFLPRSFVVMGMVIEGMIWDVLLLAGCGAIGQLFIVETITRFGAVVFTIMMTIRQAASIFLSCLWYGHDLSSTGVFGVLLVSGAVLLKPYLARRYKGSPAKPPPNNPPQTNQL